jgi:hypothetical protein
MTLTSTPGLGPPLAPATGYSFTVTEQQAASATGANCAVFLAYVGPFLGVDSHLNGTLRAQKLPFTVICRS